MASNTQLIMLVFFMAMIMSSYQASTTPEAGSGDGGDGVSVLRGRSL